MWVHLLPSGSQAVRYLGVAITYREGNIREPGRIAVHGLPEGIRLEVTMFGDLPEKTLLRPCEVAVFFSVSIRTIYEWVEGGRLEAHSPSDRTMRIYRESVVKLAKRRG
jgi:excisionase family DNA binding protein